VPVVIEAVSPKWTLIKVNLIITSAVCILESMVSLSLFLILGGLSSHLPCSVMGRFGHKNNFYFLLFSDFIGILFSFSFER